MIDLACLLAGVSAGTWLRKPMFWPVTVPLMLTAKPSLTRSNCVMVMAEALTFQRSASARTMASCSASFLDGSDMTAPSWSLVMPSAVTVMMPSKDLVTTVSSVFLASSMSFCAASRVSWLSLACSSIEAQLEWQKHSGPPPTPVPSSLSCVQSARFMLKRMLEAQSIRCSWSLANVSNSAHVSISWSAKVSWPMVSCWYPRPIVT
jgi:hypothetical protein